MNTDRLRIPIVLLVLALFSLACGFSVSTANISSAKLTADDAGTRETTLFTSDQDFYCIVELANAPSETKVKAVWTAVEVEGEDPNIVVDESELILDNSEDLATFSLTNDYLWPPGKYKVDLYLNDELDRTLEFQVQ